MLNYVAAHDYYSAHLVPGFQIGIEVFEDESHHLHIPFYTAGMQYCLSSLHQRSVYDN